ncbi:MAG: SOS response-associated peptidase [Xanthomonadales bacterium]|nr:SOS response-associated peptidase [Xanthomonadales bacterium]
MCGRYYLDAQAEEIAEYFSVASSPAFDARYNVAPTDLMPIVVQKDRERRIGPARWGLIPFWAKDEKIGYKTINARIETAPEKPAFREAWKHRRCLVPASGFYEWRTENGQKQPYLIRPARSRIMAFGGLWERWKNPGDEVVISYTIVTTPPNETVAELHDRMPLVIAPEDFDAWLTGDLAPERSSPGALEVFPVSRDVNSPRNDRPDLIERVS